MKPLYESLLGKAGGGMIQISDEDIEHIKIKIQSREYTESDIRRFNTSEVTNMHGMFGYCTSLKELDLSNFNTSKVENESSMFYSCRVNE